MPTEIERKFLVLDDSWKNSAEPGIRYSQGYIPNPVCTMRARIAGARGFICMKTKREGISRKEFEYEIPLEDAAYMLQNLCMQPIITKYRHRVKVGRHVWEVDVFEDQNEGLVIAEIELESEDQPFELPAWAGEDVSMDFRYTNYQLGLNPWPFS